MRCAVHAYGATCCARSSSACRQRRLWAAVRWAHLRVQGRYDAFDRLKLKEQDEARRLARISNQVPLAPLLPPAASLRSRLRSLASATARPRGRHTLSLRSRTCSGRAAWPMPHAFVCRGTMRVGVLCRVATCCAALQHVVLCAAQLSMGSIVEASSGRSRRARKEVRPPAPPARSPFGIGGYSGHRPGWRGVRAAMGAHSPPPPGRRSLPHGARRAPAVLARTHARTRVGPKTTRAGLRGTHGCPPQQSAQHLPSSGAGSTPARLPWCAGQLPRARDAGGQRRARCDPHVIAPRQVLRHALMSWRWLPRRAPCRMQRTACCHSAAVSLAPAQPSPAQPSPVHVAAVGPVLSRCGNARVPGVPCGPARPQSPPVPYTATRLTSVPEDLVCCRS